MRVLAASCGSRARTDPTVAAFVPSGAAVLPDHRTRPGGGSRLGSPEKGERCKRAWRYTVTVPSPTVRGTAPGVFVHCPDPPRSPCNRGGFGLQTQVCNRPFRLSITDAPIGSRSLSSPRGPALTAMASRRGKNPKRERRSGRDQAMGAETEGERLSAGKCLRTPAILTPPDARHRRAINSKSVRTIVL